jgi:deoxyribodipyrimidine photo-lyase
MIHKSRIKFLNNNKFQNGEYIVYWMQQSQRTDYNHALEYSIRLANNNNLPLIIFFGITDSFPEANLRHYYFMLQGLNEVSTNLTKANIQMFISYISPELGICKFSEKAATIITDTGYTHIQKKWRTYAAQNIKCPLVQIESDVIVPVETAYFKEAYNAGIFRKQINKVLPNYLIPLKSTKIKNSSLNVKIDFIKKINIHNIDNCIKDLKIDKSITPIKIFTGGPTTAKNKLKSFIANKLINYNTLSNDPTSECTSKLSPYLHFGHISPLYIALEILKNNYLLEDNFLEQLIIRRELSMNFVYYNINYDSLKCLPAWAYKSLQDNQIFDRPYNYSLDIFEQANTHDKFWNAAQKELLLTGIMHGYMRMYWCKKIIEWTKNIKTAFEYAIYLNNKYALDGRDPNSFAGTAWSFGKHDRPWQDRAIFGKIRYMNQAGLKRKFNIDNYVKRINNLQ